MNKPLAIVCAGISLGGILILCMSLYGAFVYGEGDMEIGNFTRYGYMTMADGTRVFVEPPTGERGVLTMVNTWFAGAALLGLGIVTFIFGASVKGRDHF